MSSDLSSDVLFLYIGAALASAATIILTLLLLLYIFWCRSRMHPSFCCRRGLGDETGRTGEVTSTDAVASGARAQVHVMEQGVQHPVHNGSRGAAVEMTEGCPQVIRATRGNPSTTVNVTMKDGKVVVDDNKDNIGGGRGDLDASIYKDVVQGGKRTMRAALVVDVVPRTQRSLRRDDPLKCSSLRKMTPCEHVDGDRDVMYKSAGIDDDNLKGNDGDLDAQIYNIKSEESSGDNIIYSACAQRMCDQAYPVVYADLPGFDPYEGNNVNGRDMYEGYINSKDMECVLQYPDSSTPVVGEDDCYDIPLGGEDDHLSPVNDVIIIKEDGNGKGDGNGSLSASGAEESEPAPVNGPTARTRQLPVTTRERSRSRSTPTLSGHRISVASVYYEEVVDPVNLLQELGLGDYIHLFADADMLNAELILDLNDRELDCLRMPLGAKKRYKKRLPIILENMKKSNMYP